METSKRSTQTKVYNKDHWRRLTLDASSRQSSDQVTLENHI
jgi:hypothetical protein